MLMPLAQPKQMLVKPVTAHFVGAVPALKKERIPKHKCLQEITALQTPVELELAEELSRGKRLALLGRLAAEIAHEINNPLNAILLIAENALRFPGEDVEHAFKLIREEAARAGQITKNVLGFARAAPTLKTLEDLNEIVTHAVALASRYIHSDRLVCAMELDESLPLVLMNVTGIEQVLVNLVKNAAEASAGLVRVVVRTAKAADGVVISVADDGPGIHWNLIPDLFTPFISIKGDTGGTGLGLSVSHRIIADHGGHITVESAPGHGTVFTIRLNAVDSTPALIVPQISAPVLLVHASGSGNAIESIVLV